MSHIDTLGWILILSTVLIFGIPLLWAALRERAISGWPVASASIQKTESRRGNPFISFLPTNVAYYCLAHYRFSVNSEHYEGRFALCFISARLAESAAQELLRQEIVVRYHPKRPTDSVLQESTILGQQVMQSRFWLT
jgi:hypothetical protein